MPKLRIRKNNRWEEKDFEDDVFSIGRESDNHLVIESFFISRQHCKIHKDEQGFLLEDLGSKVGVQVNHKPVKGSIRIKSGDLLTFADKFEAMFLDTKEQTVTTTLVSQDPDDNFTGAVLTGLDGPTNTQVFGLDKNITKVGRNPACDVCVPVPSISQAHAEIVREKRHFILTDLGSVNGSFVNNQRVQRYQLENGDLVRFDWISFRFHTLEAMRREGKNQPPQRRAVEKPAEPDVDPDRTRAVALEPDAFGADNVGSDNKEVPSVEAAHIPDAAHEDHLEQHADGDRLHRDHGLRALHQNAPKKNWSTIIAIILLLLLGAGSLVVTYLIFQWLF